MRRYQIWKSDILLVSTAAKSSTTWSQSRLYFITIKI